MDFAALQEDAPARTGDPAILFGGVEIVGPAADHGVGKVERATESDAVGVASPWVQVVCGHGLAPVAAP